MALTSSSTPSLISQKSCSYYMKPANKCFRLKQNHLLPLKKTISSLKITRSPSSSVKTKVFEDNCEGISCYRDEKGELVCEGYDEGPRFQQQFPTTTYDPRDAEIMNILLQRWDEIVNGSGKSNRADKNGGVVAREDTNWNGFYF